MKLAVGLAALALGALPLAIAASAAPPPPSVSLVVMAGGHRVAAGEALSARVPASVYALAVNEPAHGAVVLCASGFENEQIATLRPTINDVVFMPFPAPAPGHTVTETVTVYVTAAMPPRNAACHLASTLARGGPFVISWYTEAHGVHRRPVSDHMEVI